MAEFLEERLPVDVRMGAMYGDGFDVEITQTVAGHEYRYLKHPYPRRESTIQYTLTTSELWDRVVALYYRAYGMYAGFRVRNMDDFSTNAHTAAPTAFDAPAALVSAGVYQLQKQYGQGGTPLSIGLPVRTIFKPVAGTVRVGCQSVAFPAAQWSVDTTTGRVTFAANKSAAVTSITKGATTRLAFAAPHTYVVGESVHVSGVAGMTAINNQRALITGINNTGTYWIDVAINSSGYSGTPSGGVVNTRPQTGETVTAGCEFDLPCRFNSRIDITHTSFNVRESGTIDLIELVTP